MQRTAINVPSCSGCGLTRVFVAMVLVGGFLSIILPHFSDAAADAHAQIHPVLIQSPPAYPVPVACLDNITQPVDGDATSTCIEKLAGLASARKDLEDKCWPTSREPAVRRLSDGEILSIQSSNCSRLLHSLSIFHTVILHGSPPPVFGPFLHAFLATQCCSAELWVWTTTATLTAQQLFESYGVSQQHRGRVRVLPFDVLTLWTGAEAAWPEGSGDTLLRDAYFSRVNAPNQADVVRMLVLMRYGGVYLDADVITLQVSRDAAGTHTMWTYETLTSYLNHPALLASHSVTFLLHPPVCPPSLQDLRPLLALRSVLVYRWAADAKVNTAFSTHGPCFSRFSLEIVRATLEGLGSGAAPPNAYYNDVVSSKIKQLSGLPEWAGQLGVVSSVLLDPLWLRNTNAEPPGLQKWQPELWNGDFNGLFRSRDPDDGPGENDAFFGGAPFALHVHDAEVANRDASAPHSWASELMRRHRVLESAKACVPAA
jgi:hypothetical protein